MDDRFGDRGGADAEMVIWLKKMLEVQCDQIVNGDDRKEQLNQIAKQIRRLTKSVDVENFETESDNSFEQSCLTITENMHKDAKLMTAVEFETAVHMLQKRAEEQKKRFNK